MDQCCTMWVLQNTWVSQYSQIASLINKHISNKQLATRRQLGMVQRALYWAPEQARLIAYKAICLPHLEYAIASAAWDPTCKEDIADLERRQTDAIRFITNTRSRNLKSAMDKLSLQLLEQRRKSRHISLFLKILAKEEQHPALSLLKTIYVNVNTYVNVLWTAGKR